MGEGRTSLDREYKRGYKEYSRGNAGEFQSKWQGDLQDSFAFHPSSWLELQLLLHLLWVHHNLFVSLQKTCSITAVERRGSRTSSGHTSSRDTYDAYYDRDFRQTSESSREARREDDHGQKKHGTNERETRDPLTSSRKPFVEQQEESFGPQRLYRGVDTSSSHSRDVEKVL